ncbi:hypothetical protein CALVIDRAFT_492971 [Calocera viscosa TUFC12733]|uniref:Sister chromatid cohesion protein n=1 Tax=Calocera viscosa (strain TUFC12733) TaxID=1330018 RepID=A0A167RVZ9_CALVF|nr:hypothetical protein CALVIDRAFT_492971 [Calocera viscosa TUFC12733]
MDPARWPAQIGQQPGAHQNTFQPQASTSAQSLLSVYPFASTLPTGQIAQQVTQAARSATDARPYPSALYPQYYQQGGTYASPEYIRGTEVLQSGASTLSALEHGENQYWNEHQQRAVRLLREEQAFSGTRGSPYNAHVPQPAAPQAVQQPSPSFTYPTYQSNSLSSSLLQSFSYPPQASIQGTHPQHSTYPQYHQYQMPSLQSQVQEPGHPFSQPRPAVRSATDAGPHPSALYPQHYEQGGAHVNSEYERGTQVLQSGASALGALEHGESQYWNDHQQVAARLTREDQAFSGTGGSPYNAHAAQPAAPRAVQQPSPSFTYPTYQSNPFSSSLLQSFSYPPQSTIPGTHPQHSTHPQYQQYKMPSSQFQVQEQGHPFSQTRPSAPKPSRSLSQSQSQSPVSYHQRAAPQTQHQTPYVQSQAQSPAMYQHRGAPHPYEQRSSSSTAGGETPRKLKSALLTPATGDDSPDPLMMGRYAQRPSGISSQASPAHANGQPPHTALLSSPMKRKAPDGKDGIDLFASPTKRRAETKVVIDIPVRTKPHSVEYRPVSPMKPLSQKPKPVSMSSHSTADDGFPARPIPYVLVPPIPAEHLPKRESQSAPEELREMSEDVESDESLGARIRRSGVKTSGKRTGERDDRADVKKLLDYLDDIFEAEDSLPVGSHPASPALISTSPTVAGQSIGFFSPSPNSTNEPTLLPPVMRKLLRYIEASSIETRRRRRKGRRGALSQVDVNLLSRILRILDRSVKAAVDIEPFPSSPGAKILKNTPKKGKNKAGRGRKSETSTPSRFGLTPRKSGDADRRSTSRAASDVLSLGLGEPEEDMDAVVDDESPEPELQVHKEQEEPNDAALERCTQMLETVSLGVMAADCCLALLTADTLPKQLYSEDTIKGCLDVAKCGLEKVIYPIVEVSADNSSKRMCMVTSECSLKSLVDSPLIKHVTEASKSLAAQYLSSTFQSLLSLVPRIDALISHGEHAMSEAIVIAATYISIGPFFVIDNSSMGDDSRKAKGKAKDAAVFALGGKAGFPALRLSALSLIRSIFANHSDQRASIVEEILTSLIKLPDIKRKGGQFRLRNGKSIHIVSALLLQLVQTTGRDLRLGIKSLKARNVTAAANVHQPKHEDGEILDKDTIAELLVYKSGLDDAQACARTILQFLVNRSGKSKTTKDSNEAEYRAILDNFIADLLTVLYSPEWPASSLLLRLACKLMMASLEDIKTTADNATKQMALDHLGTIAAHLRSVSLKARPGDPSGKPKYRSLEEIVGSCSLNRFKNVWTAHLEISSYLAKRAAEDHSEDQAYLMAREFSIALWGYELAINLSQAVQNLDSDASTSTERFEKGSGLVKEMTDALRSVWEKDTADVFEASSDSESARIDALCQLLGATNPMQTAFDLIIHVILSALTSPAVFMRTKALRAIGQIVTCDSELLRQQNVRQTIESHLVDSSSAVREAAIELIGKYIVQESAVAGEYYMKLSERMADTGLGVRKRVMKLLRSLYDVTSDISRRADICIKMIQRLQDEDETVKDLAVKSMEEMWFSSLLNGRNSIPGEDRVMRVFMQVVGAFKDRTSTLEDLLHQILQDKSKKDDHVIVQRYTALCDSLIDTLVDGQDAEFNLVQCVQGIYLLATAHPKVMSGSRAEILLPYLRVATTADDRAITDSILKVFRASIPGMPKTAINFGEELQKVLVPMISKPSTVRGISGLQETVACLCVTVKHLTHDYARLVALLRPCNVKLQAEIKALESGVWNPASVQSTPLLMFIVAFLNEHCDFDLVRTQHPDTTAQLDAMALDSITEHFYVVFLKLYQNQCNDKISTAALQCLGIMFKAYPRLLTHDSTLTLMDTVLSSNDVEARGRVLKILQDFLASEATKRAEEEREYKKTGKRTEVDMDELIGSANTFADSGIASTVIQRYLGHILDGALSAHLHTQRFSVDILGYTIRQGLAHPLRCLPVLISLETSADTGLAARAGALHALLQNKHASMLNSRLIDCARRSFEYQARINEGTVRGFRGNQAPIALLHRWYALVREKRAPRQDLLKAIMKAFDVDTTNLALTEDEVAFVRYMAENVSALEYKTLEEVLTVVRSLMSVLSVAGMQLVDTLARLDLGDEIDANTTEGVLITQAGLADAGKLSLPDPFPVMRSSVAIGVILVLKGYLKGLYGLSEEKCLRFVIGKKSNLGDRPALRKHDYAMDYERLPFAMASLVTMEDLRTQRREFLQLWAQDGVTVDPTDDMEMDQPL